MKGDEMSAYINQLKTRKTLFMTKQGLDALKDKLDQLMKERIETVGRIRTITNDEESDALTLADEIHRLEACDAEVATINETLLNVEPIVHTGRTDQVRVGSTVTLRNGTKEVAYMIVCPLEIDLEAHKISEESPLGCALLGKKVHDTVTLLLKGKECAYQVVSIK